MSDREAAGRPPAESHGRRFHKASRYARGKLDRGGLDWALRPDPFKGYPDAPRIDLPEPDCRGGVPIWRVVRERRSVRRFGPQPISLDEVGQLLWTMQGITRTEGGRPLRAAPSAGALYPIETYLVAQNVAGLVAGLYHFDVRSFALELVRDGDLRRETAAAALDQGFIAQAAVVFIWTAVFERSRWKYRERAYRYIYLDAGHIAQNAALAAVALGLGSCQIAALYDDEINDLLGVDGEEESVVYMTAVGRPAEPK